MRRIDVPKDMKNFASQLIRGGFRCYFVGGAVRDRLLGRDAADWDAATDAQPDDVQRIFRRVIPTGVQHGTVTVLWSGHSIETTTFRVDGDYRDGRRPEAVRFTTDLMEDLSRRDFTINGMAVDPASGEVVDPHGGLADLKSGIIRAIGDPLARFDEDGLRPLRAVRFACRFGFTIEPGTMAAISARIEKFRLVSAERVREEFSRIVLSDKPSYGLRLLESTGLLPEMLPELAACRGVGQGGPHRYDVFDHLLASCDAAPADLSLRLAALFHDLGKPAKRVETSGGELTFYGHDQESAKISGIVMRRLKYPNAMIDLVVHLVRHHMFDYSPEWTDAAVRRFVNRVGLENIRPLAHLRLADMVGVRGMPVDARLVIPLIDRVEELRAKEQAFGLKDLVVGGSDLIGIGWPRGPGMGKALAELLECVLDDPDLNTRERLLQIAERIKPKYGIE